MTEMGPEADQQLSEAKMVIADIEPRGIEVPN
jgi:hypothetical protein